MTIQRMDHVGVVVDDLEAATAFFTELGLELEGEAAIEGPWVDGVNGMDDVKVDIVMMRTPEGHSKLELTQFRTPTVIGAEPDPPNTLGLRSVSRPRRYENKAAERQGRSGGKTPDRP
jgi:catechol 2,3-dioxygenase-like lactoylglutathione lyase family enzyme